MLLVSSHCTKRIGQYDVEEEWRLLANSASSLNGDQLSVSSITFSNSRRGFKRKATLVTCDIFKMTFSLVLPSCMHWGLNFETLLHTLCNKLTKP